MIVWSGLGFLTAIIVLACLVGVEHATESWFNDPRYYQANGWPKLAGLLVSAVIVWFVGNYLNRRGDRILVDPKTGEQVVLDARHTFFFIPMQYFAPVLAVLAVVFMFFGIEKPIARDDVAGGAKPTVTQPQERPNRQSSAPRPR